MTRDLSLEPKSEASDKLNAAFSRLYESGGSKLDEVLQSAGHSMAKTIDVVADSAANGLRGIKEELNFSSIAKQNPWGLVVGSFVGGAIFEYATLRLKGIQSNNVTLLGASKQTQHQTSEFIYPILFAAAQWGVSKILSKQQHQV